MYFSFSSFYSEQLHNYSYWLNHNKKLKVSGAGNASEEDISKHRRRFGPLQSFCLQYNGWVAMRPVKLRIHFRTFRCSCNYYRVCEQFVANHLSIFSTNTKNVRGPVGTVFVWIFVLFHVRRKIFLFQATAGRSWFVIFPWLAGSSWKNKFSEHIRKYVSEYNVRKGIHSFTVLCYM